MKTENMHDLHKREISMSCMRIIPLIAAFVMKICETAYLQLFPDAR